MRRISLALALVGAAAVTGCSGGGTSPAKTETGTQKGVAGQYYYINLFSQPIGGWITSTGGNSAINCGAASVTVDNSPLTAIPPGPPVYVYTPITGHAACGDTAGQPQTQVLWAADPVVLIATADTGKTFLGWAGDCTGTGTCTLTPGADKTVVAMFGAAGSAHPNYADPAVHGPAYNAFVDGTDGALQCTKCHGANLQGKGIAPSCNTMGCHAGLGTGVPPKTGLVAAITSVSGITGTSGHIPVMTFTLKDENGLNVDVTGAGFAGGSGKNHTLPLTVAVVSYAKDTAGNVLSFKTGTGNPATVTAFAAITSNTITSGAFPPVAPAPWPPQYAAGTIKQGTTVCSAGTPCTCTTPNPCTYTGTVGTQAGVACTVAAPCTTCSTGKPCSPALATADAPGYLTYNAGVYTYTFPAATTIPTTGTSTYQVWLATFRRENLSNQSDGKAYTARNVTFAFAPGTYAAATKRQIVDNQGCIDCHSGFQPKSLIGTGDFHSSARVDGNYCNICHYDGRGTAGLAESRSFIHRIHGANEMGMPTAAWYSGLAATYPQDLRNCTACHSAAAAQGGQWSTHPTIAACGSCHYTLTTTFLPVATASIANHPASNPATRTNADCATCHTSADIVSNHYPVEPPAADNCLTLNNATGCNANTNAAFIPAAGAVIPGVPVITYDISSVSTWTDTSVTPSVQRPQITFKMLIDGIDGVFETVAKPELFDGGLGGPSLYWVWAQPQDGINAPADFNASANVYLRNLWAGIVPATDATITGPDVSGYYTVQMKKIVIPTNSTMLTGGMGYTYNNTSALPFTLANMAEYPVTDVSITQGKINGVTCTQAAPCAAKTGGILMITPNAQKVATGFTGRRKIVDNAKCNACHASLGVAPTFHAGQRNDAPSCSWCHNPNRTSSGWSANAPTMVHAIHGGEARSVGFNWHAACSLGSHWTGNTTGTICVDDATGLVPVEPSIWYPEIEYPSAASNCTKCHVDGMFDFSAAASVAAVPNLLSSTVASGATAVATAASAMSNSPYVTVDTIYGAGFSIATATGVITPAVSTTLISSPIAAACFACHDTAAARSHMETTGNGRIYGARGSAMPAETCLTCHGPGTALAIGKVHQ